jgi:glycosyltransferase involved in cell wall biosynthesis
MTSRDTMTAVAEYRSAQQDRRHLSVSDGGVVVVHPGKQHAYEVALAFQRVGWLRTFVTGLYFKPDTLPYSFLGCLPRSLRSRLLQKLTKRTDPNLSSALVRWWPYAEMLSRTGGRIPWVQRLSRGRSGYPFVDWATGWYVSRLIAGMQPRPAAVYGFLGSARDAFARAREVGIPTVLDVPIVFNAAETLQREYQSLGLSEAPMAHPSRRLNKELELADWVVTPSPAVADSVRDAGFEGRGIFVVPFGADPEVFKPAAWPSQPDRFRVVFAGRLEVRKGLHYLLEAWRDARLDGELVVAGSPGEAEFVARLRQQYRGMFVEAGNLTQLQLAELLSTSDVFVLPSLAEGSALVTYQALAAGLPCIVTAEAGSVVRDGVEGFVIPARDTQLLRDRLERLDHDRDLRQRMARAALARGRQFTWDAYHRELASTMAVVLARSRPSVAEPTL